MTRAEEAGDTTAALLGQWPVIAAWMLIAIPSLANLASQTWSTELGAHGPIVLATGL